MNHNCFAIIYSEESPCISRVNLLGQSLAKQKKGRQFCLQWSRLVKATMHRGRTKTLVAS